MRRKLPYRVVILGRMVLILGVVGFGGYMIHGELARAQELEKRIRESTETSNKRVKNGGLVRNFRRHDEPQIQNIEARINESLSPDVGAFKKFVEEEAQREKLALEDFDFGRMALRVRKTSKSQDEERSDILQRSISLRGTGDYGSILRFADRLHSSRSLVAIDHFQISSEKKFAEIFSARIRRIPDPTEEEVDEESENRMHAFQLKGRVFMLPEAEDK